MSDRMQALIERLSPVHFRASLNGHPVGQGGSTFRSEDDARQAIEAAMLHRYGLVPAPNERST